MVEEVAFPSSADGYVLVEIIGRGMFNNEVWKATVPSRQNEEVAVKIIDLEEYSQDNLESIRVRAFTCFWQLPLKLDVEGVSGGNVFGASVFSLPSVPFGG